MLPQKIENSGTRVVGEHKKLRPPVSPLYWAGRQKTATPSNVNWQGSYIQV